MDSKVNMHLIEILDKHKVMMTIPLPEGVASEYSEYHAHVQFADNKITVRVYNDEGGTYGYDYEEPLPIEWVDVISKFVSELKESKTVPEYTLELKYNGQ